MTRLQGYLLSIGLSSTLCALPVYAASSNGLPTVMGVANAPVSIVAFVDLECPYSAATVPTLEKIAAANPQVRLELRQFPLLQHAESALAHEAALAAGAQGKYFAMVDLIDSNQHKMSREQYLAYAALLHLDENRFRRELDAHVYRSRVESDLAEGRALGVQVTPTLFINGQRVDGAQDAAALNALLHNAQPGSAPGAAPASAEIVADGQISAPLMHELADGALYTSGPVDAPVTIVEFTDFQCPFCRRSVEPMHQLVAASGGKVRWVYRSYPLDFHAHAELAAEAALAAGAQGKFWPMHDLLFAHQDQLEKQQLTAYASELNLDVPRFSADLESGKYRAEIAADRALGAKAGVDGTPAFLINGQLVNGARTLPELQQAVQLALRSGPVLNRQPGPLDLAEKPPVVLGDPQSAVTVTWFADVEAAAAPKIAQLLHAMADSPDAHVHVDFRTYALASHPSEIFAHRALIASLTGGHFWALYDALAGQPLPSDPAAAKAQVLSVAKSVGVATASVEAAFSDPKLKQAEERDSLEAAQRGVRGVPVVFINGKRVDGIQPLNLYQSYIQQESRKLSAALTAASPVASRE